MPGREDGIKCLADLICGSVPRSSDSDSAHHVRLLVLGGPRVGKTCICRRLLYNEFEPSYSPTQEDHYSHSYHLGATRLRVDILDTCGDNSFPAMRRVSIMNAQAILLVYSVDSYASFLQAIDCFAEVRKLRPDYRDVPTFLAGNKSDVAALQREVNNCTAAGWFYSKMPRNRGRFVECSALTGSNISEISRVYLELCGIPLPNPGHKRQLSLRLSRKRSGSPPAIQEEKVQGDEAAAITRWKPRSKSLIRRPSKKKPPENGTNECGVQ